MYIEVTKLTPVSLAERACEFTTGSPVSIKNMYKMYKSEHSPIRTQMFCIAMYGIPTEASVHFVRHKFGIEHFISSKRHDRITERDGSTNTLLGLTKEGLLNIFEYRDGKLYWKVPPIRGAAFKVGDLAGTITEDGRCVIGRGSMRALRYRIIYLMHYGFCPPMIDHINGDCSDDHIENLRACTKQENARNMKIKEGTYKGVTKHHTGKFTAAITLDGARIHLGNYDTPEDAAVAYDKRALELFGTFARLNFTDSMAPVTRDTLVDHLMVCNAQALINMARKRLCYKASDSTRDIMETIVEETRAVDEALAEALVPDCKYRGKCHEFLPCIQRRSI